MVGIQTTTTVLILLRWKTCNKRIDSALKAILNSKFVSKLKCVYGFRFNYLLEFL
jgi:hypothetical protein